MYLVVVDERADAVTALALTTRSTVNFAAPLDLCGRCGDDSCEDAGGEEVGRSSCSFDLCELWTWMSVEVDERKRKECAPFNQPNQLLSLSVLPLDLFFGSITQVY